MVQTDLTSLTLKEFKRLMNIGHGEPLHAIRILLSKTDSGKGSYNKIQQTAIDFIEQYLELSPTPKDRILFKELHAQYNDATGSLLGKKEFHRLLKGYGFDVLRGTGNRMYVFNVISNWI